MTDKPQHPRDARDANDQQPSRSPDLNLVSLGKDSPTAQTTRPAQTSDASKSSIDFPPIPGYDDHTTDKDIKSYLNTHDPNQPIDYNSFLDPSKRVIFSENTTHFAAPDGPKALSNMMDQLSKDKNNPATSLGMEMLYTNWQNDINNYMKNPDGMYKPADGSPSDPSKEGKTWSQILRNEIKTKTVEPYIKNSPGQTDDVAKAALPTGKTLPDYLTDQYMGVIDQANKDGMNVVALDPYIPNTDTAKSDFGSSIPAAIDSVVKVNDQQTGNNLLHQYQNGTPQQQQDARQKLVDYLTQNPVKNKDGTLMDDDNHTTAANEILASFDAMKQFGFNFSPTAKDSSIPFKSDGTVDENALGNETTLQFRSQAMSQVAADALKKLPDNSRMIISVGSAHVGFDSPNPGYGPTMSDDLKKQNIDSTSLEFNYGYPLLQTKDLDPALYKAYLRDDKSQQPYVIPMHQTPRPYDYYVELGGPGQTE